MYNSFKPGQIWLDTEGKRIQAHGGSVMYIDGTYYFYGENKEKTDGKNGICTGASVATPQKICTTGRTRASSFRLNPMTHPLPFIPVP